MLIKLRAPAGPARTEVLQLAEIFRARVVDVSERGLTLCVSGDPGKVRSCLCVCLCVYFSAHVCVCIGFVCWYGRSLIAQPSHVRIIPT
jgi:hypothetical protein